jgi:phosphoenolpyruvate synthase/pyruvate phosphate dikinase
VLASIREVWASPFTERSYRWRQRLLANPEHVYPSVILHKTVPSEISGVMVTVDLETGAKDALTVSVSEGVSAVVDGGAPETVVIDKDGKVRLLASFRTATRKTIPKPPAEGIQVEAAQPRDPLLGDRELAELKQLAAEALQKIPPKEGGMPWDIEFGFVGRKAYLMQIRPLRISRAATTQPFLKALDAKATLPTTPIDLDAEVP